MSLQRDVVDGVCRYFDMWLAFRQQFDHVPGVQAAVLHEGDVVLSTAYGTADVTTGEALTTGHRFRIASHSKTFTASALMVLVERGTVRLDDPVGRWVPAVSATPLAPITLRELASHSGGIVRDGYHADHWQLTTGFPDAAGLAAICADGADVLARHEQFKYSNIGYSLLGLVIEAATGRPYVDVVHDELLAPLGLDDTAVDLDPADASAAARIATGHTARSYADRRLPIEHIGTGAMASATGFVSTAGDVVRWAGAHFFGDERVLSDDAKRMMQHTEWEVPGIAGSGYGLGFATATTGKRRVLGHGGGFPGHITRTWFDPLDRVAVSVLTNAIDGPALALAVGFWRLLDAAVAAAATGPANGTDADAARPQAEVRAAVVGRFANLWGVSDVVDLGGRLHLVDPSQPDPADGATVLDVLDADTLRVAVTTGYGSPGERVRIERGADGAVTGMHAGLASWRLDRVSAAIAGRDRIRLGQPLVAD